MKEQALAAALRYADPTQRLNALREYLQSALDQTEGAGRYRAREWRPILRAQLAGLDVGQLKRPLRPFRSCSVTVVGRMGSRQAGVASAGAAVR